MNKIYPLLATEFLFLLWTSLLLVERIRSFTVSPLEFVYLRFRVRVFMCCWPQLEFGWVRLNTATFLPFGLRKTNSAHLSPQPMAPGRRRGVNKGKSVMDLNFGGLVLADVNGFLPNLAPTSDALRYITSHLIGVSSGYKEPTCQVPVLQCGIRSFTSLPKYPDTHEDL